VYGSLLAAWGKGQGVAICNGLAADGAIVIEQALVTVTLLSSVARMVKFSVPCAWGVPNRPPPCAKDSPGGRKPSE